MDKSGTFFPPILSAHYLNINSQYKDIFEFQSFSFAFGISEHNTTSKFSYKFIAYGGNHEESIIKLTCPRGFILVKDINENNLDDIDFIWRPLQFPASVT